ncbi:hypothetical protein C8R42DRAFT_658411 [Lentinula raphanica]|nr:hypothetical protein C8R42DRAFT_658411 [Lentinula raphanica]
MVSVASADDWTKRSIYQVTFRAVRNPPPKSRKSNFQLFRWSPTDLPWEMFSPSCDTSQEKYCSGDWQGIIYLVYIQDMGFDAI